MIDSRRISAICWLFAAAMVAFAQPPAPPAAMAQPVPIPQPALGAVPLTPPAVWEPFDAQLLDPRDKMMADQDFNFKLKAPKADWDLAPKRAPRAKMDFYSGRLTAPMAFAQAMVGSNQAARIRTNASDDRLYQSGQTALDNHHWDQALEDFGTVAKRGGTRADGALYWKAYAFNKLGRRDEALAAIAELRKSHVGSRWLDDAKALELEVQQARGMPVSPDQVTEEDIKVLALQGLMQFDPERAFTLTENLLKGSQSPKLKRMVVYLLAQNNSAKAEQLLEQIARGTGNPDLQLRAISYMGSQKRREGRGAQVLAEIYAGTDDVNVKRAILNSFGNSRDKEQLLQIAKTEKNADLRLVAVYQLGNFKGQPELWQIYQTETSPEVKQQILQSMYNNGDVAKLVEVAKTEKDTTLRLVALQVLASYRNANVSESLVAIYNAGQDEKIKRSIVETLSGQRNAKALVEMARAEKDTKMKLTIVQRLSYMDPKPKEAADYLMEILK